jgi:hypothetical protein
LATTNGKISDVPFGFCAGAVIRDPLRLNRSVAENSEPMYVTPFRTLRHPPLAPRHKLQPGSAPSWDPAPHAAPVN